MVGMSTRKNLDFIGVNVPGDADATIFAHELLVLHFLELVDGDFGLEVSEDEEEDDDGDEGGEHHEDAEEAPEDGGVVQEGVGGPAADALRDPVVAREAPEEDEGVDEVAEEPDLAVVLRVPDALQVEELLVLRVEDDALHEGGESEHRQEELQVRLRVQVGCRNQHERVEGDPYRLQHQNEDYYIFQAVEGRQAVQKGYKMARPRSGTSVAEWCFHIYFSLPSVILNFDVF